MPEEGVAHAWHATRPWSSSFRLPHATGMLPRKSVPVLLLPCPASSLIEMRDEETSKNALQSRQEFIGSGVPGERQVEKGREERHAQGKGVGV